MQRTGRIHWLAVLGCYLLDDVISVLVFIIAVSFVPALQNGSLLGSSVGIGVAVVLVLSTIVSGWLAARIAREERFLHGFLVGGIGILMMLIESFGGAPLLLDGILLQFLATALAGVAGYFSDRLPVRQREK